MSLAPLRDALATLRAAFHRPGVLHHAEDLVLELPYDAGRRFESYVTRNAPVLMHCSPDWLRTTDGPIPHREVTIDGVKVTWPLKRVALPHGASIPEPLP